MRVLTKIITVFIRKCNIFCELSVEAIRLLYVNSGQGGVGGLMEPRLNCLPRAKRHRLYQTVFSWGNLEEFSYISLPKNCFFYQFEGCSYFFRSAAYNFLHICLSIGGSQNTPKTHGSRQSPRGTLAAPRLPPSPSPATRLPWSPHPTSSNPLPHPRSSFPNVA